MNWELRVYKPIGGPHIADSLIASYTPSSPGGIVGEMRWTRRPDGDCVQFEWEAVPSLVDIPPRAIVQLLIDGTPVWYGVAVRTWPKRETRVQRYTALGGRHLLRAKYFAKIWSSGGDTGTIAGEIIANYRHPSLQAASVSASGYSLTYLSVPGVDVATVLDRLAQVTPGTTWGVDASGTIYWGRVSRIAQIAGTDLRNLPVVSELVWDMVHFVLPSGGLLTYTFGGEYGAERAFILDQALLESANPTSVDLPQDYERHFYSTDGGSTWVEVQNLNPYLSYLYDNSLSTCLRASGTMPMFIYFLFFNYQNPAVMLFVKGQMSYAYVRGYSQSNQILWTINVPLGNAYIPLPSAVSRLGISRGTSVGEIPATQSPIICELRTLVAGSTLYNAAAALVRTPYLEPTEFVERGIIEPATTVILQEAGASVSPVEWEYTLSPEGGAQTRIRVGTPTSQEDAVASSVYLAASALDEAMAASIRMGTTERPV